MGERGLQWQTEAVYSRLHGSQGAQCMCSGADRGFTGDDRKTQDMVSKATTELLQNIMNYVL